MLPPMRGVCVDVWVCGSSRFAVKKTKLPLRSAHERAEILSEFRVGSSLGPHPNIVAYHVAWQEDGHLCFLMEYCGKVCTCTRGRAAMRGEGV